MKTLLLKDVVIVGLLFLGFIFIDKLLPNYNHNSIPPAIVPVNDTIHIKGLGNFNSSSLDEAKNILESTFGVICVIKTPEKTKNNMYFDGGSKLEVNSVVKNLR